MAHNLKQIPSCPEFWASDDGLIFKLVVTKPNSDGYLCMGYKEKKYYQHRLVAEAFLQNWDPSLYVNHKNAVTNDNRVENLEMVTHSENLQHAFRLGLFDNRGCKNKMSKLNNNDVRFIKSNLDKYSNAELAKMFCVDQSVISRIKHGKSWRHI